MFFCKRSRNELKTILEQQFEKRVFYHICTQEHTLTQRISLLQDFHHNSNKYYDRLCDILYAAAKGHLESSIWMTPSGQFYVLPEKRRESDLYLCSCSEIPSFHGDLVVQLEHIFLCIYQKMVENKSSCGLTPTL